MCVIQRISNCKKKKNCRDLLKGSDEVGVVPVVARRDLDQVLSACQLRCPRVRTVQPHLKYIHIYKIYIERERER
jgi:hypothetical protein